MHAESLSLIAGTLLSLFFSYIPGAKNWFENFDAQVKRLIMLSLIILSSAAVFGLSCLGWGADLGITIACNQKGLMGLVQQVVLAIIANQGIFAISPHRNASPPGRGLHSQY